MSNPVDIAEKTTEQARQQRAERRRERRKQERRKREETKQYHRLADKLEAVLDHVRFHRGGVHNELVGDVPLQLYMNTVDREMLVQTDEPEAKNLVWIGLQGRSILIDVDRASTQLYGELEDLGEAYQPICGGGKKFQSPRGAAKEVLRLLARVAYPGEVQKAQAALR